MPIWPERIKAMGLDGYGTADAIVSVEATVDRKKYAEKLNKV